MDPVMPSMELFESDAEYIHNLRFNSYSENLQNLWFYANDKKTFPEVIQPI